jgi:DNA phosphorothioation-dependent restriction protein DptG
MYDPRENRSSASVDVLNATKELLGNNEYAIEAIRYRNKKIKDLEDIISHQDVAFQEIEERYDEMSKKKDDAESGLEKLEEDYKTVYEDWKKISGELEVLKKAHDQLEEDHRVMTALRDKTFSRKVEIYADKVGGKRGAMLKLLFTPPVSKIILLIIFVLLLVASIVGWGPVAAALKPLLKIFY